MFKKKDQVRIYIGCSTENNKVIEYLKNIYGLKITTFGSDSNFIEIPKSDFNYMQLTKNDDRFYFWLPSHKRNWIVTNFKPIPSAMIVKVF